MEQSSAARAASLWPYSERNSATAHADMAALLAPPEQTLVPEELQEARAFARGLYDGVWGDEVCASARNLEQIRDSATTESMQEFHLGYFATPEGWADLALLGVDAQTPPGDIAMLLHDISYIGQTVDAKTRKEISARSVDWYKDSLAERLLADPSANAAYTDAEPVRVNYKPDKLLDKFADLQAFRQFYRSVWRNMKDEPASATAKAKRALLEVYVAWVNNKIADLYPSVWELARQVDRSRPDAQNEQWRARLQDAAPHVVRALREREGGRMQAIAAHLDGFARRLDLVRNGAAPADGDYTPFSQELLALADNLQGREAEAVDETAVQFSAEELAVMDKAIWTADDLQAFNKDMLDAWGLLSEHDADWQAVQERSGPAPDGKWQVVVTPKKKSLSVDGSKRVIWVPQKFKRSLTQESPAGGLPVSAHELTHVWQTEFDDQLAEQVPLAKLKGRRYVTVREMGGIAQERSVQAAFGRTCTTNAHYLRALQVKTAGGTRMEVARAFYSSYTTGKTLDAAADKEARDTAVDRTARLYRHGGHNSQPLDYLEQELLATAIEGLDSTTRQAIIIAGGSLSWNDAAKLHRVGLLELPREVRTSPAADVIHVFRQRYLPALLASAA